MERISIQYRYERRSPVVVDVRGSVHLGYGKREEYAVAVFLDKTQSCWVASDSLAIDQGGTASVELSDAIYCAREKIETALRLRVINGGSEVVATAELDAFMETREPGNTLEELSARVRDLTYRVNKLEEGAK